MGTNVNIFGHGTNIKKKRTYVNMIDGTEKKVHI